VLRRRRSTSVKARSPKKFFDECDRSGGGFEADKVDFETEFERLMEDFVEKKMTMIAEIKARYEPQIAELES
jgi:hypothetical protein